MYNAPKPDLKDLPSTASLRRSTIAAGIAAIVIAVTVYLPAEHGTDPTGMGRVLGLTEMGEIKQQLAREAAEDHQSGSIGNAPLSLFATIGNAIIGTAHAHSDGHSWDDQVSLTLQPGEGKEIKLVMKKGDAVEFAWVAEGGRLNYDLHGDGKGHETSYIRGRGVEGHEGRLIAAFDGNHGWFWRNRDRKPVTMTLSIRGQYSDIKRYE